MQNTNITSINRCHILDILKAICIWCVIFTHTRWAANNNRLVIFPFLINMAVPFFILTSGYVWAKSFKAKNINSLDAAYTKNYFLKSFIRYIPPVLLAYCIELFFRLGIAALKHNIDLIDFAKRSYFELFYGCSGPGSYWPHILVQLTVIFPVLYIAISRYKLKAVLITICLALFLEIAKFAIIDLRLYRILLFRYLPILALGVYFSIEKTTRRFCALLLAIGILSILVFCYSPYKPIIFRWWQDTSMFPSFYAAGLFVLCLKIKDFSFAPLEKIGRISYHIFLFQMIYFWLSQGLEAKGYTVFNGNTLATAIMCILFCTVGGGIIPIAKLYHAHSTLFVCLLEKQSKR